MDSGVTTAAPTVRRRVPSWPGLLFLGLIVAQSAMLIWVRAHPSDWFAGGNSASQWIANLSVLWAVAIIVLEVVLSGIALLLATRSRWWLLLPLPLFVWMLSVLILAASGPGAGAA